jgi:glycerate 2-kinase
MRILIAPDKFKGSLSAMEACQAIESGIKAARPDWSTNLLPLADGGEGTADVLTCACSGTTIPVTVHDPLGRLIETHYGVSPDGTAAFLEMAAASGLSLLRYEERNPMVTSTVGTGEMIFHAIQNGAKRILLGCGGSATNDAGMGMMQALGVSWLNAAGQTLLPIGQNLIHVNQWKFEPVTNFSKVSFQLITDVHNPLFGKSGAAFTFGPQKGASSQDIDLLEAGLRHLATLMAQGRPGFNANTAGCGAAGGLPAAARFFLDASLAMGIDYVLDFIAAEERIKNSDLVITGEGKLDQTSLQGKTVCGVVAAAHRWHKPVWVICGINELSADQQKELNAARLLPLVDAEHSLAMATRFASARIREVINMAVQEIV